MSDFTLGEHSEAIRTLQTDVTEIKATSLRIELALAEKKGERRVALAFASIAGSLAAGLVTFLIDLVGKLAKH